LVGWCREQDLNLHAFWALDPKSNASANSAIPACFQLLVSSSLLEAKSPIILTDALLTFVSFPLDVASHTPDGEA
jgi:hypothetical protein